MLAAAGDERVARQARAYFKSSDDAIFFGVRAPKVREIEKQIYGVVGNAWGAADALRFADMMIRRKHLEAKAVGILLLSRYARAFDEDLSAIVRAWLAAGYGSNWATTDLLSTAVVTPLLDQHPELLGDLVSWTGSEFMWVRRAAAVSLTPLARKGKHLETAYAVAAALLGDREDLMHKAVGWLLRECGKTDPRRLEAFLLKNGACIPRTALRYAIERFPVARRRRLLERTRSECSGKATLKGGSCQRLPGLRFGSG